MSITKLSVRLYRKGMWYLLLKSVLATHTQSLIHFIDSFSHTRTHKHQDVCVC